MLIKNTDIETACDWPEGTFIQGGGEGIVIDPKGNYRTAFVETTAGDTFIRGEGKTIAEAEQAAWTKYLAVRDCDGSGEPHGPFEARHYENGAGYCTRCGAWFSNVLPRSKRNLAHSEAFRQFENLYGRQAVLWHPRARDWIDEQTKILVAVSEGDESWTNSIEPPTEEELVEYREADELHDNPEKFNKALDELLTALAHRVDKEPDQ